VLGAVAVAMAAHPPTDDHHGIVEDQYQDAHGVAEPNV